MVVTLLSKPLLTNASICFECAFSGFQGAGLGVILFGKRNLFAETSVEEFRAQIPLSGVR
jgi:hypothetical protein